MHSECDSGAHTPVRRLGGVFGETICRCDGRDGEKEGGVVAGSAVLQVMGNGPEVVVQGVERVLVEEGEAEEKAWRDVGEA